MRGRHALRAVLELVAARLRARPGRAATVAGGVAAAGAVLVGVIGGGLVAADLRQRADLQALPDEQRAFSAVLFGTAPDDGDLARADDRARKALSPLAAAPATRSVVLRDSNLAGGPVAVGAVDDIARWVALDTGRLPGPCRPRRCEVVQVTGRAVTPAPLPGARLVVVGTGRVTSAVPFGSERLAGHIPLLVAADTAGLSALPGLSFVYRTTTWTAPIVPDEIHHWQVENVLRRSAAAARSLQGDDLDIQFTGPLRELVEARDAGRAAMGRLVLFGAAGAALVAAFALLAASMLRDDLHEDLLRLELRGATTGQRRMFTLVERGAVSLAGIVAGVLAGMAAVAAIAREAGLPVAPVLRHSIATPTGLALLAGTWIASALMLALTGSAARTGARIGRLHASDLVAGGALAAAALAAARGGASPDRLASGDVDPLLPALPLLIALAAGAGALRMTAPVLRALERRSGRRHGLAVRLAVLAQARRPRRVAMTVSFLVVAIGFAIFASGYRATLVQGQRDQADFAAPVDAILRAGPSLEQPLDLVPVARLAASGDVAHPVIRSAASIRGVRSQPLAATLIGIPADAIRELRGWRTDFSPTGRAELAAALHAPHDATRPGPVIPAQARTVTLAVRRSGQPAALSLVVKSATGRSFGITLGVPPDGAARLSAPVPPAARGGAVIGLRFFLDPAQQVGSLHSEAEGRGGDTIRGSVTVGPLLAGAATIGAMSGWVGRAGATVRGATGALRVDYQLGTGRQPVLRPPHAIDRDPLPVLASRDIAEAVGVGGDLVVSAGGERGVPVRVVAAASRFPTLGGTGSFVVADARGLETSLDALEPGAGRPNELWVDGASGRPAAVLARLDEPPFTRLETTTNAAVRERIQADPLARGALWTLWSVVGIALALGIAALALASATDLRDERRELADLQAQGLARRTLRHQLRLRGVVPLTLGTLGGAVLGLVLVSLVVRLVLLTAGSETPVPPLTRQVGWPVATMLLAGYLTVGTVVVATVTRRADIAMTGDGTRP